MIPTEQWLQKLTNSEIKHRDKNYDQQKIYQKFDELRTYNNRPVYLFKFDTLLKAALQKSISFSNELSDKTTLLLNQHYRYSVVPLHVHDYIEINYVISGQVTEWIEGNEYILKSGDMAFINTNTVHTLLDTTEKDIIINILIKKEYFTSSFLNYIPKNGELSQFIAQCLSIENNQASFLIIKKALSLKPLLLDILTEQLNQQPGYRRIMELNLQIFFIRITRQHEYSLYGKANLADSIEDYINRNFRDITLKTAAEHFSFHPNYFSKIVHEQTGKTFKNLVQEKQFEFAKSYLINTSWSISQIINEVGISNHSFFYRKFHELYQLSPKDFRQQNKSLGQK
jgi:AraC-like DNA-binding protein/mannose-6-phosphate isomerase-like protein (cupin superfamily)